MESLVRDDEIVPLPTEKKDQLWRLGMILMGVQNCKVSTCYGMASWAWENASSVGSR